MKEDVRHHASCCRFGMQRRAVSLCPDAFLFTIARSVSNMTSNTTTSINTFTLESNDLEGRIAAALEATRAGIPVILLDDFDRENEADLIVAADKLTVETMAVMIRECSGIVCLCLSDDKVRALELPPMAQENGSRYGTPFTVSIEAREGVTTGVSAQDRVTTIRAAIAPDARPQDLVRPGHVFPLRANPAGVLGRKGHTEGSVDLAILAGLQPSAVLCELMNEDGTMMRGAAIERFARRRGYPILTIAELIEWRTRLEQKAA
jgi:3,4-dihydroxy 2-butanone 4-phosphate synthase